MHWVQPHIPFTPATTSLSGKTIIVTGANTGLGFEAARQLLQLGTSTLILAVRDVAKGLRARTALLSDPRIPCTPTILVYELNLSSHTSVIAFVRKVNANIPVLDVLLLNGAVNTTSWTVSPSTQNELIFQVNFLSNALLSILLLPLLRSSAKITGSPSRLTFVGSQGQEYHVLDDIPIPTNTSLLAHLNNPLVCSIWRRYSDCKLLLTMWVYMLAAHLDPSEVTANILCPGLVYTGIYANLPLWLYMIMSLVVTL